MKMRSVLLVVVLLSMGLISCRGINSEPTQERLRMRVEGFIEARQERDLDELKVYYKDPNLARVGNIRYVASKLVGVAVDKSNVEAEVELRNSFKVMGFTFKDVPQKLRWKWVESDWFLVESKNNSPFGRKTKRVIGAGSDVEQKK